MSRQAFTRPILAAMAALATFGAGPALADGRLGPAAAGTSPGRIEFVAAPAWQSLRGRADAGVLVIDVEGLESAEAAGILVDHWRRRLGAAAPIACWLKPGPTERSPRLLAQVAAVLVDSGCDRVRVPT